MKKVFFSEAAQNIIPVDEVSRYSIIGYAARKGHVKGLLTIAHGRTLGVTVVNGPAHEDIDMPAAHPIIDCAVSGLHEMMKDKQDVFNFYVFQNVAHLLMWLLEE